MDLQRIAEHYPAHVGATIADFSRAFTRKEAGVYSAYDWNRIGFVASLVTGDSVLDVGVGNGAMLHVLLGSGRHRRVCGVDIRRNQKLRLPEQAEFHLMDVAALEFEDREFDTVICMEVLEHLPPEQVEPALASLRRVAGERLFMSLPYREPYPLYHQELPTGHKQSFDDAKLDTMFPHAFATFIPHAHVDWILLAESPQRPAEKLTLLPAAEFAAALGGVPPLALPPRPRRGLARRLAGRAKREWQRVLGARE